MSDLQSAATGSQAPKSAANEGRVSELRSSASMMRLDAGLYCVLVAPCAAANAQTGLPGLRITAAPGPAGRPEAVEIRTISTDGWLSGFGDAALVRVSGGPAFVMVTIYQDPTASADAAPNLQILPLINGPTGTPQPGAMLENQHATAPLPAPTARTAMDIVAHIQGRGDVGATFGEWLGEPGSGKWLEGFGMAPTNGMDLTDIEYQVTLGRGWMSPWVEGGQFCGSRGMALPILGVRVRLRGAAAEAFELRYSASFVGGAQIGPVAPGEPCELPNLAPVEALKIEIVPTGGFNHAQPAKKATARAKKR